MSAAEFSLAGESPRQSEVWALIEALDAYQIPLYPIESHHGLDQEALCEPHIHFLVARDAQGHAVGCGAIALGEVAGQAAAELKRMYVCPTQRGKGLGKRLLEALTQQARALGATRLYLETGCRQPEAIALYEGAGFARIPAFGSYAPDPLSVFMMKELP